MYGLHRDLTPDDFAYGGRLPNWAITTLNWMISHNRSKDVIKAYLPEGYLQKRMVMISAASLWNIYIQRRNHELDEWQGFISQTTSQLEKINPQVMELIRAFTAERRAKKC